MRCGASGAREESRLDCDDNIPRSLSVYDDEQ
jgi:hypothetical protein